MRTLILAATLVFMTVTSSFSQTNGCDGRQISGIKGLSDGKILADGTILGLSKLNINIDGLGRAYHAKNAEAGALIHLCNAGEVFLSDGSSYHGSVNNETCVGRFMRDFRRIQASGWSNSSVGVIRWYGILGRGTATINGRHVSGITPVLQADGSGFYVSPTSLADETITDAAVQNRYVNPLRIPAAVIPNQPVLAQNGIVMGSFGVAFDPQTNREVPFVVGDFGPRVGEATPALARSLAGLPITDNVTRNNRFAGQIDASRVVWIFFGRNQGSIRHNSRDEQALNMAARSAFERWGGPQRLRSCIQ